MRNSNLFLALKTEAFSDNRLSSQEQTSSIFEQKVFGKEQLNFTK
jgi:hypothetical protein